MKKETFPILDWQYVENYLAKENEDSLKLAMLEAEKIFLKIVSQKAYKTRNMDEKISLAISEVSDPKSFLKAREIVLNLKNRINFDIGDVYSGEEILDIYKKVLGELVYGKTKTEKFSFLRYKLWPFYYYVFLNRKRIFNILLWIIFVIVLMLFVADTSLGRNIFDFFIEQIHFIIRLILAVLLAIFIITFLVVLFIIILESRRKKNYKK